MRFCTNWNDTDLYDAAICFGEIASWFPIRSGSKYPVNNAKITWEETTPELNL